MDKTNKALKSIYRELGYTGPLPGDESKTRSRGGGAPQETNETFGLPPLNEKDKIKLTYYDWLQKVRHVAEFPV